MESVVLESLLRLPILNQFASAVNAAISLAYRRGLLDGFLSGVVVTLLLFLPRFVAFKGEANAAPPAN